jgi:hypothetical protein
MKAVPFKANFLLYLPPIKMKIKIAIGNGNIGKTLNVLIVRS